MKGRAEARVLGSRAGVCGKEEEGEGERKKEERFGELRKRKNAGVDGVCSTVREEKENEERTMMGSVRFSEYDGLGARWKS